MGKSGVINAYNLGLHHAGFILDRRRVSRLVIVGDLTELQGVLALREPAR